jgi:hypothetical protein
MAARRQETVAPAVNQGGEVVGVIGMKVREGDMGNLLPRELQLRHAVHHTAAAVHEQERRATFD